MVHNRGKVPSGRKVAYLISLKSAPKIELKGDIERIPALKRQLKPPFAALLPCASGSQAPCLVTTRRRRPARAHACSSALMCMARARTHKCAQHACARMDRCTCTQARTRMRTKTHRTCVRMIACTNVCVCARAHARARTSLHVRARMDMCVSPAHLQV